MQLTPDERHLILSSFRLRGGAASALGSWSRRQYAPMHIHSPELASLRRQLALGLPDYRPVFDVVFETAPRVGVAFHCDYESLGPFDVERAPWRANRDAHFVSVHFNLTPDGGALRTLAWPRLSHLYHRAIVAHGIFGWSHRLLNLLLAPLLRCASVRCSNRVGVGNAFNNMRLHAVEPAEVSRVSYVVRLVRRGGVVRISPDSLQRGSLRSPESAGLAHALAPRVHDDVDAAEVPWAA